MTKSTYWGYTATVGTPVYVKRRWEDDWKLRYFSHCDKNGRVWTFTEEGVLKGIVDKTKWSYAKPAIQCGTK